MQRLSLFIPATAAPTVHSIIAWKEGEDTTMPLEGEEEGEAAGEENPIQRAGVTIERCANCRLIVTPKGIIRWSCDDWHNEVLGWLEVQDRRADGGSSAAADNDDDGETDRGNREQQQHPTGGNDEEYDEEIARRHGSTTTGDALANSSKSSNSSSTL